MKKKNNVKKVAFIRENIILFTGNERFFQHLFPLSF